MRVAIEPRKATDRGGYYCMPLKVNVPTGRKDWKLTKCPECGAQCWELPLAEVAKAQGAKGDDLEKKDEKADEDIQKGD